MKWTINYRAKATNKNERTREIVDSLFSQRGMSTQKERDFFLDTPSPLLLTAKDVGINQTQLNKAIKSIKKAIDEAIPILVYGDYDADGIAATAILWETLHRMGADAYPFIPSRESHGYGLSIKGLETALEPLKTKPLIITVDNGIVANESVLWLKDKHIGIIITDHHQPSGDIPKADAVVHSTAICGAGVAWIVAKELNPDHAPETLDLACIGTVADMMPLTGPNRQIVKYGLKSIRKTKRPGLIALLKDAGVDEQKVLTPIDINYTIAPRLNAMGRLEHAIDSLRLLCTTNQERAKSLAILLSDTNRNRQDLTETLLNQAKMEVGEQVDQSIIVIDHEEYHEGIIGLIAGKLVETYYRPAIVISRKKGVSKASARSIKGVNITELIRTQVHLLLGVGGHPMAAGFSIETKKIKEFRQSMLKSATESISKDSFIPNISIDCQVELEDITDELYQEIEKLQPFGIGNPTPVFAIKNITPIHSQKIGSQKQHLKLIFDTIQAPIDALWFGHGATLDQIDQGSPVDIAFTIGQNTWRNNTKLQLLLKDIN